MQKCTIVKMQLAAVPLEGQVRGEGESVIGVESVMQVRLVCLDQRQDVDIVDS